MLVWSLFYVDAVLGSNSLGRELGVAMGAHSGRSLKVWRLAALAAACGAWTSWRLGGRGLDASIALLLSPAWSSLTSRRGLTACFRRRSTPRGAPLPRGCRIPARASSLAEQYPAHALHKELFNPKGIDEWVVPELRTALAAWHETGDPLTIDVAALPEVRIEAPGVISFAFFEKSFCARLLDEVRHYTEESGFPQAPPNSMNRYGAILNDIGLRPGFSLLLRRYLLGIGARLFGDPEARAESLGGEALGTDDWGGSTLSDHHTFVVRYQPDRDRGLDMHVDDCDITFNFGLTDSDEFLGGDLVFCGMFAEENYRREHHTYRHEAGRCVMHAGKRRHAVSAVEAGERASLVMWTKSILWRNTAEYKEKCGDIVAGRKPFAPETGPPDRVCLSLSHDRDYLQWAR